MTDPAVKDLDAAIHHLMPNDIVLFRHYDAPDRAGLAKRLRQICANNGFRFWVSADVKLAQSIKADGVHIPWWCNRKELRIISRARMSLSVPVHNLSELRMGLALGAQFMLISPIFKTTSHPHGKSLGLSKFIALHRFARKQGVQTYALGGMNERNLKRLPTEVGLAGIRCFEKPKL